MGLLKTVLIGGTRRAEKTLNAILEIKNPSLQIEFCIFMPGHPDELESCSNMEKIAESQSLKYFTSNKIDGEILDCLKSTKPDVMIGLGIWRTIISDEVLKIPKLGYIGLHGTPLPRLRGFAGIYWQIINGYDNITTRFYRLDPGIDSGPYVCDEKGEPLEYCFSIKNEDHLEEILECYDSMHVAANLEIIDRLVTDRFIFKEQPKELATYACHRGVEDGEIDWNSDTFYVFNFIRAQSKPCPGAYTYINNQKVIIWRAKPRYDYKNYEGRIYGKVVSRFKESKSAVILTSDGGIEILECEVEGKNVTPIKVFHSIRTKCQSKLEAKINLLEEKLGFSQ